MALAVLNDIAQPSLVGCRHDQEFSSLDHEVRPVPWPTRKIPIGEIGAKTDLWHAAISRFSHLAIESECSVSLISNRRPRDIDT